MDKANVYEGNNNNNSSRNTSNGFAYISAFLALWRADCWCERTDQNDHLIIISAVNEYNIWFHITLLTLLLFTRENFSSHHFIYHFNWKRNFFVCFIFPSSSSFYATACSFCILVSLLYLSDLYMPTCTQTQRIIVLVMYCILSGFRFCQVNSHCDEHSTCVICLQRIEFWHSKWFEEIVFVFLFITTVINFRSTYFFMKFKQFNYSYQTKEKW